MTVFLKRGAASAAWWVDVAESRHIGEEEEEEQSGRVNYSGISQAAVAALGIGCGERETFCLPGKPSGADVGLARGAIKSRWRLGLRRESTQRRL